MIKVTNLTKQYKTYKRGSSFSEAMKSLFIREQIIVDAVKNISFEIEKGELVSLLGPNGAGKSTTLKMLTGVLYPTSGSVEVMGYIPWEQRKKYVGNIGAVFGQKSQLIWDIPPIDAFQLNKAIYDISDNDYKSRLDEFSRILNVKEHIYRPTRQLSLGERMKCEFIMAMLHNPQIVFLDEPTIGLDVIAKENIREFIKAKNKQGITFILTTHDLSEVKELARRIIIINHGVVVYDDTIEKLKGYLGNKKQLILKADEPIIIDLYDGITFLNQSENKQEITIEIDTNKVSVADVISQAAKKIKINDITLNEPQIENIIKSIYLHN